MVWTKSDAFCAIYKFLCNLATAHLLALLTL